MKRRTAKVSDVLEFKGSDVMTVRPSETIKALSELLQEHNIGAMIVSEDGFSVDGIISERDLAYGIADHAETLHALPVSLLMTRKVITCSPSDSLDDVAKLMNEKCIRHVPVTERGRLVGVVSMRDIVIQRLEDIGRKTRLVGNFVVSGQ